MAITAKDIADIWSRTIRETPWHESTFLNHFLGLPRPSYRETLDRPAVNWHGDVIPRRVILERNARLLGPIRLDPKRLPD